MTNNAPRLDNQLCFALYSASSALTAIYRPLLEEIDLTYPQFLVMMALWEQDNVPISVLAANTSLTKSTMTPLLKRLEQKDFIIRQFDLSDERKKTITLTPKGRKLSTSAANIAEQAFCATGLSKKQAMSVIEACQTVVGQMTSSAVID